ncbi:hypothetical protein CesoFtcFv8_027415 [Champsocephalus esox]|uniref:Uncharacterized protein n=1 Tax=Champsocephalus esox TaxID=159716 RepID=A0AAN7YCU7_9TELE|nr:hypothetical protein CesoFtcFv8_027415 [Champsocephalus esox]
MYSPGQSAPCETDTAAISPARDNIAWPISSLREDRHSPGQSAPCERTDTRLANQLPARGQTLAWPISSLREDRHSPGQSAPCERTDTQVSETDLTMETSGVQSSTNHYDKRYHAF